MKYRKATPADIEKIGQLFAAGESFTTIGKIIGLKHSTVNRIVVKYYGYKKRSYERRISDALIKKLGTLISEKISFPNIAKQLKISVKTIRKYAQKYCGYTPKPRRSYRSLLTIDEPSDAIDFDGFRLPPECVARLSEIKSRNGYYYNRPETAYNYALSLR